MKFPTRIDFHRELWKYKIFISWNINSKWKKYSTNGSHISPKPDLEYFGHNGVNPVLRGVQSVWCKLKKNTVIIHSPRPKNIVLIFPHSMLEVCLLAQMLVSQWMSAANERPRREVRPIVHGITGYPMNRTVSNVDKKIAVKLKTWSTSVLLSWTKKT